MSYYPLANTSMPYACIVLTTVLHPTLFLRIPSQPSETTFQGCAVSCSGGGGSGVCVNRKKPFQKLFQFTVQFYPFVSILFKAVNQQRFRFQNKLSSTNPILLSMSSRKPTNKTGQRGKWKLWTCGEDDCHL